eukprot:CAMPEP_0116996116 /NCGR_PEP_ID=MMETSP0472-20121206/44_1 /TAXON_ID=693140 ORGANISM="Tiarina fusus, Strain LIS" /NCGR_SAMPLE_ID=MMETSP0472 /ASSEMBLY_ACC=CAM_ASM_000603 /LENGTH=252 /DNA_ID=CAMNT_0004694659 /DNA_START=81 /DNA_END=840 /DNA_ORIENTATION=-
MKCRRITSIIFIAMPNFCGALTLTHPATGRVMDGSFKSEFLGSSEIIDTDHPSIQAKATELASEATQGDVVIFFGQNNPSLFEFVRDEIEHSSDFHRNPVTCKASAVLEHGTGFCYAKSHLLAALLRANGIPTGLCYQRLTISDDGSGPPYCLHGLNAVYLEKNNVGDGQASGSWFRIDPRGVKPGITKAEFCPPTELLAFPIQTAGEFDFPGVYVDPLPQIVETLHSCVTWNDVLDNLPDLDAAPLIPTRK